MLRLQMSVTVSARSAHARLAFHTWQVDGGTLTVKAEGR